MKSLFSILFFIFLGLFQISFAVDSDQNYLILKDHFERKKRTICISEISTNCTPEDQSICWQPPMNLTRLNDLDIAIAYLLAGKEPKAVKGITKVSTLKEEEDFFRPVDYAGNSILEKSKPIKKVVNKAFPSSKIDLQNDTDLWVLFKNRGVEIFTKVHTLGKISEKMLSVRYRGKEFVAKYLKGVWIVDAR